MPYFSLDWLRLGPWGTALVAVVIVAALAFVIWRGILVHRRRVSAGKEDLVGKTARVRTALKPEGTVFIEGELWTAVSEEGRVKPGEEVIITAVDNLVLRVVPAVQPRPTKKRQRR